MHVRAYIISNGFTDLIIIIIDRYYYCFAHIFIYFFFFILFIAIIFLFNLIKNDNIIFVVTRRRIHFRPGRFARGEHIPFVITPATESGHKSIYVYRYYIYIYKRACSYNIRSQISLSPLCHRRNFERQRGGFANISVYCIQCTIYTIYMVHKLYLYLNIYVCVCVCVCILPEVWLEGGIARPCN